MGGAAIWLRRPSFEFRSSVLISALLWLPISAQTGDTSKSLFTLDFVCLVGAALRVRDRRLTPKQYREFQHMLVEIREGNRL
jgi:hypothetical protein